MPKNFRQKRRTNKKSRGGNGNTPPTTPLPLVHSNTTPPPLNRRRQQPQGLGGLMNGIGSVSRSLLPSFMNTNAPVGNSSPNNSFSSHSSNPHNLTNTNTNTPMKGGKRRRNQRGCSRRKR